MNNFNTKTNGAQPDAPVNPDNLSAQLWPKSAPDEYGYFVALSWAIKPKTLETLDRFRPSDFRHPMSALIYQAALSVRGVGINHETLADECNRRAGECDRQTDVVKWENAGAALEAVQAAKAPNNADEVAVQLAHKIAPHSPEDWGEPLPLKNALYPVPALPEELIPAPLRGWVWDCAERIGVAPDYVVIPALVAAASLIGNTVSIRPKKRDDWRVVPNLWGAPIGDPSVKKSPAQAAGIEPLAELKSAAIARYKQAAKDFLDDAMLDEIGADAFKIKLKKMQKDGADRDELKAMIAANRETEKAAPTLKTYSVQDATIEALAKVSEENPRGFLIERDELPGWLKSLEKQGHEQDKAFFLEAWNGTTKNFQIQRITRGTVIVPNTTISILGTIQPGPYAQMIRAAAGGSDGFIARFQMVVYPDPLPKYTHVDRYPDAEAKKRAFKIFETLDALTPEMAGAQCDGGGAAFVRFDSAAQPIFDEWITEHENRLPKLDVLIQQHLAKYRSLMPSLALLFHLIGVADGSAKAGAVGVEAAMMAAAWCEFLEAHARRIYAMAVDGATDGAELIASRFGQLPNPFTVRDVARKQWAGLTDKADVEGAIARLEERGWILAQPEATGEKGGRPTTSYTKHPLKAGEK